MIMTPELIAIGLALLSALMFAVTFTLVRVGSQGTATREAELWITLSVNVVFLWGWSLLVYRPSLEQWWEWRYFFVAGLFAPLLGRLFQFMGMARLGSNITTPLTLTHPVVSIVLAVLFLQEGITLIGLAGALLVVSGSILVGTQGKGLGPDLQRIPKFFILLPLVGSVCYGISMIFRKIGIDLGTDAVTAAAVTTSSSWLFASLFVLGTGTYRRINSGRRDVLVLIGAGIFSSLGPVLLYMALQYADLVVVAPLAATTPLFVLLMSYLFIRTKENFSTPVVVGTFATVAGVMLVSAFGVG